MTDMYNPSWEDLTWHEPPPSGRWGPVMDRFTQLLAKRPGEWGELPPPNDGYPASLAQILRRTYTAKGYEFRTSVWKPGSHTRIRIWGRYVDPEDPEREARANLRSVRGE